MNRYEGLCQQEIIKDIYFLNIVHRNPTKHLCESSLHSTDFKFHLMLSPQFSRSSEWWPGCGLFPAAGAQSGVDWRVLNGVSTQLSMGVITSSQQNEAENKELTKNKKWRCTGTPPASTQLHLWQAGHQHVKCGLHTQAQFENSVKSFSFSLCLYKQFMSEYF